MLQGCVEHEVCGEDMKEENTCFFWLAYDADPRGGWLRRETAGGRHGDTLKIVAGVRAAEGVVEAQLGTGRAIGCCRGVCGGLEITVVHSLARAPGWGKSSIARYT